MTGGDLDGQKGGAGFEARLEATFGGHRYLFEPTLDVFLAGGVQHLNSGVTPEYHVGGGIGLDLLFSRLLDAPTDGTPATVLLPFAVVPQLATAIMFLLVPTAEFRYVVRADGTHYASLVVSMGL